jgi:hypothetical protein
LPLAKLRHSITNFFDDPEPELHLQALMKLRCPERGTYLLGFTELKFQLLFET